MTRLGSALGGPFDLAQDMLYAFARDTVFSISFSSKNSNIFGQTFELNFYRQLILGLYTW